MGRLIQKTSGLFITMLIMYPAVIGLFAISKVALSLITQASGDTNMGTLTAIIALVAQPVIAFSVIMIFKYSFLAKGVLGRLANNLTSRTTGLVNRARETGQNTQFYQRRQLAREARTQERRRGAIANYAEALTPGANAGRIARARAALLRRRAAGGVMGQVFGTNAAGQMRVQQGAEDTLRKQRQEEAQRALQRMSALGIEGDADLSRIATGAGIGADGIFRQSRNAVDASGRPILDAAGRQAERYTGVSMRIGEAERQAAINALVSQGRASPLRQIESTGPARGRGGVPNPNNTLHRMLDEAYSSVPNKLGDKSPDILPNRRATEGLAAFTDVQPNDVAGWHHSTVSAAERFYDSTGRNDDRAATLRAFGEAASTPSTVSKLSPEQVTNFRNMMVRFTASGGTLSAETVRSINDAYVRKGGNIADPAGAVAPAPNTPRQPTIVP